MSHIFNNYDVIPIEKKEAIPWITIKHYAKRLPNIKFAFGLKKGNIIVGVCTFSTPTGRNVKNIVGEYQFYELNRLIVDCEEDYNCRSFFVSKCLKKLPKPSIIISYADSKFNHFGFIYQATNWIYTGQTSEDIEFEKDGHTFHRKTMYDFYKTSKRNEIEKLGYFTKSTSKKHRYIFLLGSNKEKKDMLRKIPWEKRKYPKGKLKRYDCSTKIQKQCLLF